jgi:PAS domain S-box-containing protein
MKNAIPSSILILNKDNTITNWNKKAEEMLGLELEKMRGVDVFAFEMMEKERVREGMDHCLQEKKLVTVKSVALKNLEGTRYLTDITHIPLLDAHGELQGTMMIIDDKSDLAATQAELERKQHDLEQLDARFQETYAKLKLADIADMGRFKGEREVLAMRSELERKTKDFTAVMEEKQRELDSLHQSILSKTSELDHVTIQLEQGKAALALVADELVKRQRELESKDEETRSESWKEKLKIYSEIDKCLNITAEDTLKTKKLKDRETDEGTS